MSIIVIIRPSDEATERPGVPWQGCRIACPAGMSCFSQATVRDLLCARGRPALGHPWFESTRAHPSSRMGRSSCHQFCGLYSYVNARSS